MPRLQWFEGVDIVAPHIVRILTPRGHGTGFLLSGAMNGALVGIATADHVVSHAHEWGEPLKIFHAGSAKPVIVEAKRRGILSDAKTDVAAIVFPREELQLPAAPLPLIPQGKYLREGGEIGWLGYPSVSPTNKCFFRGSISCWLRESDSYLVDGVAINGVSGAPAFTCRDDGQMMVVGLVTAYLPNRATGASLPGLSEVQSVLHMRGMIATIRNLDEAKAAETEMRAAEPIQVEPEAETPPVEGQ